MACTRPDLGKSDTHQGRRCPLSFPGARLLQPQAAGGTWPPDEGLAFLWSSHHPLPPSLAVGPVLMPSVGDVQTLMEGCALQSLLLEMRPWGEAASGRWVRGQEGRGGAVSSGRSTLPH